MSNLKKVLIVDDLASWQDSLAGLLSDIGCILEFAATVPDAKQRLQSSKFDLCIIDIRLQEDVDYDVGGIDLLDVARLPLEALGERVLIVTLPGSH